MFSKCLHVNRDHNLVVVNYALKKIFQKKLMWQVVQRFSSHLYMQSLLLICSFPISRNFSGWHIEHAGNNALDDIQMHVVS